MLKLKPVCENCSKALPPESNEAMICTYECTFCRHCVESILHNVCPNCGGGFCPRPHRPHQSYRPGTGLVHHPADQTEHVRPVDQSQHDQFSAKIKLIEPDKR